jgi:hypothetical protein
MIASRQRRHALDLASEHRMPLMGVTRLGAESDRSVSTCTDPLTVAQNPPCILEPDEDVAALIARLKPLAS